MQTNQVPPDFLRTVVSQHLIYRDVAWGDGGQTVYLTAAPLPVIAPAFDVLCHDLPHRVVEPRPLSGTVRALAAPREHRLQDSVSAAPLSQVGWVDHCVTVLHEYEPSPVVAQVVARLGELAGKQAGYCGYQATADLLELAGVTAPLEVHGWEEVVATLRPGRSDLSWLSSREIEALFDLSLPHFLRRQATVIDSVADLEASLSCGIDDRLLRLIADLREHGKSLYMVVNTTLEEPGNPHAGIHWVAVVAQNQGGNILLCLKESAPSTLVGRLHQILAEANLDELRGHRFDQEIARIAHDVEQTHDPASVWRYGSDLDKIQPWLMGAPDNRAWRTRRLLYEQVRAAVCAKELSCRRDGGDAWATGVGSV